MEPPASAGGVREAAILGVATGTWAAGVTLCRNVGIACAAAATCGMAWRWATSPTAMGRGESQRPSEKEHFAEWKEIEQDLSCLLSAFQILLEAWRSGSVVP